MAASRHAPLLILSSHFFWAFHPCLSLGFQAVLFTGTSTCILPRSTSIAATDTHTGHFCSLKDGLGTRRFTPRCRSNKVLQYAGTFSALRFKDSENETDDEIDSTATTTTTAFLILNLLLPLLLTYVSNQWSRSSIYYLVDFSASSSSTELAYTAMNVDLSFTQAQYGLLASVGFTALFAFSSLLAGGLADRYDRKILTISSTIAWSAATLGTAFAHSYNEVLAARVFMGLACGFSTPSAYTLIRDIAPKDKSALASSLYGSGVYLGGALASLSILLDDRLGWRGALGTVGVYGLVAAGIAWILLPPDPALEEKQQRAVSCNKNEQEKKDEPNVFDDVASILSIPRVQWLFLGSFVRFCAGLCIGVWAAPYYRLAFPSDAASYAVANAFIVGLCGVTSGVGGGYAADRAASLAENTKRLDGNAGRLAVPILGSALAVPAWWATINATSFKAAMVYLGVEYLVAECWFGPTVAVLQSTVGPRKGGTAQGMFALTGALGNFAPSLLGVLYGAATTAKGGNEDGLSSLSGLLGVGVCAGYALSAVCFTLSALSDDSLSNGNVLLVEDEG